MQLSLPQGKLDELRSELEALMQRKRASKQQLQFLAGKLNWAASVVYSGRVFLPHIIYAFCKLQHKTHKICVSHETHQDIAWWHRFLETFNGKSLLLHKNPITQVYTDACTSEAGGLWDGDWFHCCWDIDLTVLRLVFMLNPCTNLPNCPAFMYILESKTHILSYATFLQMLKSCLSQIGLDPSKYSGHSFRRGGGPLLHLNVASHLTL